MINSVESIYKIGPGPSSSHTIAPFIATKMFLKTLNLRLVQYDYIRVNLYGSLALTGEGHKTFDIIKRELSHIPSDVTPDIKTHKAHPNTMEFEAFLEGRKIYSQTYYSIGGGDVVTKGENKSKFAFYDFNSIKELQDYLEENKYESIADYVLEKEGSSLSKHLDDVITTMFTSVEHGLSKEGELPAGRKLHVERCAKILYQRALKIHDSPERKNMLISSFAYATSEENASFQNVVTAPTCGSAGVIPSIIYYEHFYNKIPIAKIKRGLMTAGMFGNVVKKNATISGAVGGCQAEIGVAASMAAALLAEIYGLSIAQVEYAAEAAMEHFLGLTCDPVEGFVIIPCIERNAVAAAHAYACFNLARYLGDKKKNQISFDEVVEAMSITGKALDEDYKETAKGGLAKVVDEY